MKDNVIKLPRIGEDESLSTTAVFDFSDINPETMEKVFDVMNFLSNRNELVKKFKSEVEKFLSNETSFDKTVYKKAYDEAFADFVLGLIKNEIVDHFNFTPEEVLILTDKDFINLLSEGFYFDKTNYKGVKDGENENSLH